MRRVSIFPRRSDDKDQGFLREVLGLVVLGIDEVERDIVGGEEVEKALGQGFGCSCLSDEKELAFSRIGVYRELSEGF